ncbi:MAG: hypothetical protein ACQEUZ_01115 [Pseudomonadota bacterium]
MEPRFARIAVVVVALGFVLAAGLAAYLVSRIGLEDFISAAPLAAGVAGAFALYALRPVLLRWLSGRA